MLIMRVECLNFVGNTYESGGGYESPSGRVCKMAHMHTPKIL